MAHRGLPLAPSPGRRPAAAAVGAAGQDDIARFGALWNDGLRRFGGPFLAGNAFTAVDGFYAPVAFRIQTYGITLDAAAAAYAQRLLDTRAMREWYGDALKETLRDEPHEEEISRMGKVLEDLRAK